MTNKILLINDDKHILDLLFDNIKIDNTIVEKSFTINAIGKLESNQFHLVLTENSDEILDFIKVNMPQVPVIIIGTEDCKEVALMNGATFVFSQPYDYMEIKYVSKNLLDLYEVSENFESSENIITALSKAIDAKDSYTEGHSRRVADTALELYDTMERDDISERKALYMGCILHDIGKIGIPDVILLSPKFLTPEEKAIMDTHPARGFEICKNLTNLRNSLPVIRNHHEKLDGSGYPDNLIDIPIIVQICTIADIFDALTSKRVYRNENSIEEAIEIMKLEAEKNKINLSILSILEQIKANQ